MQWALRMESIGLDGHLVHRDLGEGDDEARQKEARLFFGKSPHLQFLAELYDKLRTTGPTWWTPEQSREAWPAAIRMGWFSQRPDIRQRITTKLTGLAAGAARRFWPDEQATLIDAVLDSGDIPVATFEAVFDAQDIVVYGAPVHIWQRFRERMPLEDESEENRKFIAWVLRALLADRSSASAPRGKPILDAWEVRGAIDAEAYQQFMPLEVRVAVDQARLKHERSRPREPFHARHELAIATPERIAAHLPLAEIAPVFLLADRAIERSTPKSETIAPTEQAPDSVEPPRPSQIN